MRKSEVTLMPIDVWVEGLEEISKVMAWKVSVSKPSQVVFLKNVDGIDTEEVMAMVKMMPRGMYRRSEE